MSVDSTALERATLERKDRDELVAIAQALGGKPPSRAKKADIVDIILDLTGVGSGTPAEAAPAKPARARKAAAPAPAADEVDADEAIEGDADADVDDEDQTEAQADEEPATAAPEPAERPERPERNRDRGQGGQGQGGQGGQGDQHRSPNSNQNGNQNANRGDSDGDGDADGEEGGNRRRRRRGRNRGEGQGQGQGEEPLGDPVDVEGIVDLRDEGYGFLRLHGFLPSRDDAYISVKQARQFGLRRGDIVSGASRPALRNEKNPALLRIDNVNGVSPEQARDRRRFDDLTAVLPDEKRTFDAAGTSVALGERALVITTGGASTSDWLRQVASSVDAGQAAVIAVVIDERPEEVTEWQRAVVGDRSQLAASTFDRPADEHVQVAELAIERAKRLAEAGEDVIVVLDGLTRLARAGTLVTAPTGRTLPGGADAAVVHAVKRVFGAGRRLDGSGSLTLIATLRTGNGSSLDEAFAEELRPAANREIRVDGPSPSGA